MTLRLRSPDCGTRLLVNDPAELARLWQELPGRVAVVARREGLPPHRVLDRLRARLPDDAEWYGSLTGIDAAVREHPTSSAN